MIFLLFDLFVTTLTTLTARGHSGREWGWSRFRALLAMGTARPTSKTTAYYSFGEICGISSKVDVSRGVPKDRARQKSIARQNPSVTAPRPPNESSSPHPLPHMNLPLFKKWKIQVGGGGVRGREGGREFSNFSKFSPIHGSMVRPRGGVGVSRVVLGSAA